MIDIPVVRRLELDIKVLEAVNERWVYDEVCSQAKRLKTLPVSMFRSLSRAIDSTIYEGSKEETYFAYSLIANYWEEFHEKLSSGAVRGAKQFLNLTLNRPAEAEPPWGGNPCSEILLGTEEEKSISELGEEINQHLEKAARYFNKVNEELNMPNIDSNNPHQNIDYTYGEQADKVSLDGYISNIKALNSEIKSLEEAGVESKAVTKAIKKKRKALRTITNLMDKYHG